MAVEPRLMRELVGDLSSEDPRRRESGADRVTDHVAGYSRADVRLLTGLISLAAVDETDHGALEAELNAVLELGASGFVEKPDLFRLTEVDMSAIPPQLVEYLEDILEAV